MKFPAQKCALIAITIPLLAARSEAAITILITEVSGGVSVSGSGSFDVLPSFGQPGYATPVITPSLGAFYLGGEIQTGQGFLLENFTGPASFGDGAMIEATSGSGDNFGLISGEHGGAFIQGMYNAGDPLAGISFYAGESVASMGLNPGVYVWEWNDGVNFDSITLTVIPEPSGMFLLMSACLVGCVRRSRD